MATSTATLQLHHREIFERNVTWALAAGGAAGALHWLGTAAANLVGHPAALFPAEGAQVLPLTYATVAAVCISMAKGDKLDRLLLLRFGSND